MSEVTLNRTDRNGFDVVTANTGVVSLQLMPELGGKINSLRDERTGREWLWRNPRLAYQHGRGGGNYVTTADTGGWDECFPTVATCRYPSAPWAGATLPDHGELWGQPCDVEVARGAASASLRTVWHGIVLPFTFERSIRLTAGSGLLRFEYSVTNNGEAPLQFIWSAHPLLNIQPGMRLSVPAGARFNRETTIPSGALAPDSGLQYPLRVLNGTREVDLSVLPDAGAGVALKLWSDPLTEGWASLRAGDGELRMRWEIDQVAQLALWLNLGAWAGDGGEHYYNLGLEPCLGAQDSLATAITEGKLYETLPVNRSRNWSLEVELIALDARGAMP
jgi:galactose mutarotase-like enzyme